MIAFRVPVGRYELVEDRFFGHPLHEPGHMLLMTHDEVWCAPCKPTCHACKVARWEHDPGDEDDGLRKAIERALERLESLTVLSRLEASVSAEPRLLRSWGDAR